MLYRYSITKKDFLDYGGGGTTDDTAWVRFVRDALPRLPVVPTKDPGQRIRFTTTPDALRRLADKYDVDLDAFTAMLDVSGSRIGRPYESVES